MLSENSACKGTINILKLSILENFSCVNKCQTVKNQIVAKINGKLFQKERLEKFSILSDFNLRFRAESQRINAHLLHHCYKSVAACRRQVFLQSDGLDEVEIGIQDLLRCVV